MCIAFYSHCLATSFCKVNQVRDAVHEHYSTIVTLYNYYAACSSKSDFSVTLNAYSDLLRDAKLAEVGG